MKENRSARHTRLYELYEHAKMRHAEHLAELSTHMEQYDGSDKIDGSPERAATVRNITYELIEAEVSSEIPAPKAEPCHYTLQNERNARSIERLLYRLRDELPFEAMNDFDERYTYIYGAGVWLLEWEEDENDGGVRILSVSPEDFIPQPDVWRLEDMDYCFFRFATTRDELCRRYGVTPAVAARATAEGYAEDEESVTVIVAFYKDADGNICRYVFSGEATLADDLDYYSRRRKVCSACGCEVSLCTCEHPKIETRTEESEQITHEIRLSDGRVIPAHTPEVDALGRLTGRMLPTELPYYKPRRFPVVVRRNNARVKSLYGQSDAALIRPQQQAINKVESRILQKLMRAGITPMVPEDAAVSVNNAVFGQVIRLRPGESGASYGVIDTTPDISQDVAEAERLYTHARRVLGISDSYQGYADSTAISGVAKRMQIEQSAGRLESKRKLKHAAYAEIDRLIFEFYLAFADRVRHVSYRDADGATCAAVFNRYDFLVFDETTCRYIYDDGYLFSVDQNGGVEQQREMLWQQNLDNLRAGTLGDAGASATLLHYWQCQERAHYPFARENVEYFQRLVDKEKEEKNDGIQSDLPEEDRATAVS